MPKFEFDYLYQSITAVDAARYIRQHGEAIRGEIAEHYSYNIGTVGKYLDSMVEEKILGVREVEVVIQHNRSTRIVGTKTKTRRDVYSFAGTPEVREFLRILNIIEKYQRRLASKYKR